MESKMPNLTLTTNPIECIGNDEVATIWRNNGKDSSILIASLSASPRSEKGREFGKQLVQGYNNTYGSGINPDAVPYLLSVSKDLMRYKSSLNVMNDVLATPEPFFEILDAMAAAIELSKI